MFLSFFSSKNVACMQPLSKIDSQLTKFGVLMRAIKSFILLTNLSDFFLVSLYLGTEGVHIIKLTLSHIRL